MRARWRALYWSTLHAKPLLDQVSALCSPASAGASLLADTTLVVRIAWPPTALHCATAIAPDPDPPNPQRRAQKLEALTHATDPTREKDKLLIAMAAEVARKRLARGVKLNHPEAIALITDAVVEGARDGRCVADMMEAGAPGDHPRSMHGGHPRDDPRRSGRGTFPDGTKLVTVHNPIR